MLAVRFGPADWALGWVCWPYSDFNCMTLVHDKNVGVTFGHSEFCKICTSFLEFWVVSPQKPQHLVKVMSGAGTDAFPTVTASLLAG